MNLNSVRVSVEGNERVNRLGLRQNENPRPVIGNKRVHFATVEACHIDCDRPNHLHADEDLDLPEAVRIRSQLWYSTKEYEEFISDRLATIEMFRSLQGKKNNVLEDYYCLRGLEPFQHPSLQTELRLQRIVYVDAVLSEQRRAKLQKIRERVLRGEGDNDDGAYCLAYAIKHQIEHVSKWAMQRAQRLAALDEIEAQKISGRYDRSRLHWPTIRADKGRRCDDNSCSPQKDSKRKKFFTVTSSVNVVKLKEMNRRLLEKMGVKSFASMEPSRVLKTSPARTDRMSLNALMRASIIQAKRESRVLPLLTNYLQPDPSTILMTKVTTNILDEHDARM